VSLPYRGGAGPLNLLIDSTGIKAEGEGEWNARKHGGSIAFRVKLESLVRCLSLWSNAKSDARCLKLNSKSFKRRIWRKIHIGIDEETLEVRAVEVTGSNIGDAPVLPELLNQIPLDQDIGSVTAPSRQIDLQSPAGQWTGRMTRVNVTRQLPPEVPMQ